MLGSHITLPGSRDFSGKTCECSRCKRIKLTNDGVSIGANRWVCGACWRGKIAQSGGGTPSFKRGRP
jgi:hypothetical protein